MKTRRMPWALMVLASLGLFLGWAWAQDDAQSGAPPAEEFVVEEPAVDEPVAQEPAAEEYVEEQVEEPPAPIQEEVRSPLRPTMPTPNAPVPRAFPPARPGTLPSRPTGRPFTSHGTNAGGAPSAPPSGSTRDIKLEPKDGLTANEPISFDFDNVPLNTVIESIARVTGKNFDVDPNIGSIPVTVITHDRIPPDLAYQVLESVLSTRGFSLMETLDGHLIKVVKTGTSLEKTPLEQGKETTPDRYDSLVTHVVVLQYASAEDLANIVRALGSESQQVTAYVPTNTLIITDTVDGLRRIFSFLDQVDVPGLDTQVEIFTLEYTRAEVLSTQIEQVLTGGEGVTGASRQPMQTAAVVRAPVRPTRPTVPGSTAPMLIGAREEVLRIVPDERLNALIVVASESLMERVRDLVLKLDTPTPYEANNMHVYELLNANAEQVEEALNTLVGTAPRKGTQQNAAQTGEIQPFEKKVTITRYEQKNALLILASPQDYKLIKEIIAQLDVPVRQVHIESIILQVEISDDYTLTVEQAAFQKDEYGVVGLNNVTKLAEVLTTGGPLALAGGGLNIGYMSGTTHVTMPGTDGALTEMTIPNVPLLLTALETMTDLDVLSQPSLTTQDNETANIVVGKEVPVPTQRSGYSYGQQNQNINNAYQGLTSYGAGISREDVGVKMTVTPHINEGDYVSAEVEIEVSAIAKSGDIDVNELGPTFSKSQIKNNVVIKDGSTAVVGGLITENVSHGRTQTPILGDIPVLGWLFRSTGDSRLKQNLVVLLTPHIVKEGVELDRLTAHRMNEFRDANVDVLFEQGFIHRIKKRHEMRNKYRPSVERSESLGVDETFGRGDIKR